MSVVTIARASDLVRRCKKVALDRDAIKLASTDRRVSSRPGWAIHFDGLRAECAVAQYFHTPQLVNFSTEMHGDGGSDMHLGALAIQTKASTYLPPYLRFDIVGSQRLRADAAVLAYLPQDAMWVDLHGWVLRCEFMRRAQRRNFGYGDRLILHPPLHSLDLLSMMTEVAA
jgi:hypothetical protein